MTLQYWGFFDLKLWKIMCSTRYRRPCVYFCKWCVLRIFKKWAPIRSANLSKSQNIVKIDCFTSRDCDLWSRRKKCWCEIHVSLSFTSCWVFWKSLNLMLFKLLNVLKIIKFDVFTSQDPDFWTSRKKSSRTKDSILKHMQSGEFYNVCVIVF